MLLDRPAVAFDHLQDLRILSCKFTLPDARIWAIMDMYIRLQHWTNACVATKEL